MQRGRITRSQTKSLQQSTVASSSQNQGSQPSVPTPPSLGTASASDLSTPVIPPPIMSDRNIRETPPHQQAQGSDPVANPAASSSAAPAPSAQSSNPQAPRSRVKTRDPDPCDGSDPAKLRLFLSQCKLVFRSRPEEYRNDHLKIVFAGSSRIWHLKITNYLVTHAFGKNLRMLLILRSENPIRSPPQLTSSTVLYHHLNKYNFDFR